MIDDHTHTPNRHLQHGPVDPDTIEHIAAGLDKVLQTTPGTAILPQCLPLALAAVQAPQPSVRSIGVSQLGAILHVCGDDVMYAEMLFYEREGLL